MFEMSGVGGGRGSFTTLLLMSAEDTQLSHLSENISSFSPHIPSQRQFNLSPHSLDQSVTCESSQLTGLGHHKNPFPRNITPP